MAKGQGGGAACALFAVTPQVPLRVILAAVLAALVWSGWLGLLHLSGRATLLDPAEAVFVEIRDHMMSPPTPPGDVVIVAIDDATVADAGGYPIDRARLAALVRAIRQAGARALAVDLLFVDQTDAQADAQLAEEMSQIPTVVAAAGMFEVDVPGASAVPTLRDQLKPLPVMANAARVGLVNVATDVGGTPRHVPLMFNTVTGPMPSFALQAAVLFERKNLALSRDGVRVRGDVQALDIGWHMPIRYYGPRGTLATLGAQQVLSGAAPQDALHGKLVVVGATATGIGDRFDTPFDAVLPGVEIQATAIANLLDGTMLQRGLNQRRVDTVATSVLVVAGVFLVAFLPLTPGVVGFMALLIIWLGGVCILYGKGYWLSMSLPLIGSVPAVVGLVLIRQIYDHRKARRQLIAQQELSRFQSPALARRIAGDPTFLLQPQARDAAILFVDLAGFTGASERLGLERTRDMLKEFHTLVVEESATYNGLVLDFMGDGAMIGFGLPDARPDTARDALCTAFALVKAVRCWIAQSGLSDYIQDVRVGAHCGTVILSRLGHEQQQQITTTGDCVNVASRLMEVGKSLQASITVSAQLIETLSLAQLGIPDPDLNDTFDIRGRDQKLAISAWKADRVL